MSASIKVGKRYFQRSRPTPAVVDRPEYDPIPPEAELHDLSVAAEILTKQYGKGYSYSTMYRRCGQCWQKGVHYTTTGSLLKVYLPNIHKWQEYQGRGDD